jgi:hypothetical protein
MNSILYLINIVIIKKANICQIVESISLTKANIKIFVSNLANKNQNYNC